jgi:hypothetical protein
MAAAKIKIPARGAIAQLGERIVRNDEVVGSSPTSSTKFPAKFSHFQVLDAEQARRSGGPVFSTDAHCRNQRFH